MGQGSLREPLQGQRPLPAQLQVHGPQGGAGARVEVRLPDGHGDGRGQVGQEDSCDLICPVINVFHC